MILKIYLLFTLIAISAVRAEKKSYKNYKVYKIVPETKDEVDVLVNLQNSGTAEFWKEYFNVKQDVKAMVSPEKDALFLEQVKNAGIEVKEVINDVQELIDDQLAPSKRNVRHSNSFLSLNWDVYHPLEVIYDWLDEVAAAYPDVVSTVVMGKSVEDRDIKGIVINYKKRERNETYVGMIEGTLHAREWITPATVTWIVKEFLTSTDPEVRHLAENIEWHVFPIVNPDGYSYTFTDVRMWRKNRSKVNSTSCEMFGVDDDMSNGVDLNRNFDFVWMSVGASDNPCSNTFAGPAAFSEPESQAIAQYVRDLKTNGQFIYYYAFHSFTQLIIIPYSNLTVDEVLQVNNYPDMYEIAIRGAERLKQRYGTIYRVGISGEVMYQMSGTSFDWVKYEADVPVTYLFELRDLGEYGFLLPPEQIIPTSEEIMDALVEMDKITRILGYYRSGTDSVLSSIVVLVFGIIYVYLLN